jgi:ribosomal protein S18 acetylase RimI-like enzyme
MRIRTFGPADTERVIALWEACGLIRPWNDPRKDIERKLRVQPELFLVGERDGRLVASGMGGYDGHRGWVYYLAVDPAERGGGLGRALMDELERRMLALGCPKINLLVRDDNTAALGFYDALGYTRDASASLGKRLIPDV